jgi:hypothetical protein
VAGPGGLDSPDIVRCQAVSRDRCGEVLEGWEEDMDRPF